jgi:hypothetical protein
MFIMGALVIILMCVVLDKIENYMPSYNALELPYFTTSSVIAHVPEERKCLGDGKRADASTS